MAIPADNLFLAISNYKEIAELHTQLKQSFINEQYATSKIVISQIQVLISPNSELFKQLQQCLVNLPQSSRVRQKSLSKPKNTTKPHRFVDNQAISPQSSFYNSPPSLTQPLQPYQNNDNSYYFNTLKTMQIPYQQSKKPDISDINIEQLRQEAIYKITDQKQQLRENVYQYYAYPQSNTQQSLYYNTNDNELEDENDGFIQPPFIDLGRNQSSNQVQNTHNADTLKTNHKQDKTVRFSIEKEDLHFNEIPTLPKINLLKVDVDQSQRYDFEQLIDNLSAEIPPEVFGQKFDNDIGQIFQQNNKTSSPISSFNSFQLNPIVYAADEYTAIPFTFLDSSIILTTIKQLNLWDNVQTVYQKLVQTSEFAKEIHSILIEHDIDIAINFDYSRDEVRGLLNLGKIYFGRASVALQRAVRQRSPRLGSDVRFGEALVDAGDLVGLCAMLRAMGG
ncbi:hypothetical protein SS50377_23807 [Spironucleus salmonicida]|uniref:Uncharacterized protein n=1 Tax=Spironucleus salmonicida TaxID=348837 RepID=V6LPF1_9EUKA|nr:hypothetical protein SS50377_23807 [Spironucleus salmonicida]|eukprot:EST46485.1 Hypothetical protein SS50377_13567 [Spironucleus salmonicida]